MKCSLVLPAGLDALVRIHRAASCVSVCIVQAWVQMLSKSRLVFSALAGVLEGTYDSQRCLCNLERLDRPTETGWDGLPGIR